MAIWQEWHFVTARLSSSHDESLFSKPKRYIYTAIDSYANLKCDHPSNASSYVQCSFSIADMYLDLYSGLCMASRFYRLSCAKSLCTVHRYRDRAHIFCISVLDV